ncbi:MAG: ankyrin repeat domain-containing protein [Planctomycetes bacterium]|nr:ankyrin repeat domain-containing protein [Planctomycetota bacterium]
MGSEETARRQAFADEMMEAFRRDDPGPVATWRARGEDLSSPLSAFLGPPLHVAAVHGAARVIAALLEAGADPRAPDRQGRTLLESATLGRDVQVIERVVELGFDLRTAPPGRASLFELAVPPPLEVYHPPGAPPRPEPVAAGARVVRFLRRSGLVADGAALRKAVAAQQEDDAYWPVVEALLEAGADVNDAGAGGLTPLMAAAMRGTRALIERLLAAGARADARDAEGRTALDLHEALAFEVDPAVVALLTDAGGGP